MGEIENRLGLHLSDLIQISGARHIVEQLIDGKRVAESAPAAPYIRRCIPANGPFRRLNTRCSRRVRRFRQHAMNFAHGVGMLVG